MVIPFLGRRAQALVAVGDVLSDHGSVVADAVDEVGVAAVLESLTYYV